MKQTLLFLLLTLGGLNCSSQKYIEWQYKAKYLETYEYYTNSTYPTKCNDNSATEYVYFAFSEDNSKVVFTIPGNNTYFREIPVGASIRDINTRTLTHELFANVLKPVFVWPFGFGMDLFVFDDNKKIAIVNQRSKGDAVDIYQVVAKNN